MRIPRTTGKLEADIADLEREYADLEEVWHAEKAAVHGAQHVKEELERARLEYETAQPAPAIWRACRSCSTDRFRNSRSRSPRPPKPTCRT